MLALRFVSASVLVAAVFLVMARQPAQASIPPVQDSAPFNSPGVTQLGAGAVCGVPFDCHSTTEDQTLKAADQCATTRFGFQSGLMTEFRHGGDYDQCAVATTAQSPGASMTHTAQWPVCCIVPNPNSDGTCTLQCNFQFVP
jgi:hypothetical protein